MTGFMGSGKSSVGKELSALLSYPVIDLDSYIEEKEGRSIPEIFASGGEAAFRRMELDALTELLSDPVQMILSLGGGTLTTPECAELVHRKTLCIYLRAATDTLVRNLEGDTAGRPMLSQGSTSPLRGRIEELMSLRSGIYESSAHHIIDIDGKTVAAIASEIVSVIG